MGIQINLVCKESILVRSYCTDLAFLLNLKFPENRRFFFSFVTDPQHPVRYLAKTKFSIKVCYVQGAQFRVLKLSQQIRLILYNQYKKKLILLQIKR